MNSLEILLREWRVEIPSGKREEFERSMVRVLEKIGFSQKREYWENEGKKKIRVYTKDEGETCIDNVCGRVFYLSVRSILPIEGMPPAVTLIDQAIYSQPWTSLTIKRNP